MNINAMLIKIYHSFIIQDKEDSSRIFELLQAFKPIAVLIQTLLITRTDGIDNVRNHVIWYLGAFPFSCCSQAVEALVP